ncbi:MULTISPECIES: exonuclease domain-containing protein [Flavobacteriaceae]|uniref:DNA polymerase III subunit epsilon n=2 Tax=Flavobacteriaceae TaxID=49546 RepID=A0A4Y8AWG0_9FLAO|nr:MULTISPECIES: exonuclease domain-containing protein [Flavobacteriaceae]TEW76475.1 DNA polymerase III subunit epsilon [Gramella jeungdoensis]GGK53236.1 exonuclease [Lutibacter litoralis]
MYAIVDIETTGHSSKITEISIFIFNGKKIIDEYTTLVNPECVIPPFITNLTGITNAMVGGAPKFYEIAKKVQEITEDCIFVAHNVNFDYNIINKEFKDLGFEFKRKKLCTIRLSRKLIPGLKSYSLGALCNSQNIVIKDRHRAKGDAEATTILFEKLLKLDTSLLTINSFLKPRSRQATLPPMLPKENIDNLSEKAGVYYFKNIKNEIIYVGKANNIKQRVVSHFYDKSKKEVKMCLEIATITFKETGSELVALLLESSEIKKIYPKYNRAQRRSNEIIGLFSYEDRNGVLHLAYNRLKLISNPLLKFYNLTECRLFLEKLCETYKLCPKYCHLQTNVATCFHYQIKQCKGICKDEEAAKSYNKRVLEAIESVKYKTENFIIKVAGRTENENAYILILNGIYKGYGYADKTEQLENVDDYNKIITSQKDNNDIKRILNYYIKNNTDTIYNFKKEQLAETTFNLFAS